MKFKLDENPPHECVDVFRLGGCTADTVNEEELSGAADGEVIARCESEQRILVTLDLDFADVRAYPPGSHPGIIVLRPSSQDKRQLLALTTRLLAIFARRSPAGQLWIVDQRKIRVRDG